MTPRQWKRLFAHLIIWGSLVGLFVLTCFLSVTTWHVYQKEREARQSRLDQEASLAELQKREASLSEQLKQLDTPRGIEKVVRERFPLVKPGEEQIILLDSTKKASTTEETGVGGFWKSLVGWFSW